MGVWTSAEVRQRAFGDADAVSFGDYHVPADIGWALVGEPVGERPNSYSENDEMTLPNSGLVVSYSTRYYKFLDQDLPAFLPDVRIDPSWPDFRAGRDPVMEWILRQAR